MGSSGNRNELLLTDQVRAVANVVVVVGSQAYVGADPVMLLQPVLPVGAVYLHYQDLLDEGLVEASPKRRKRALYQLKLQHRLGEELARGSDVVVEGGSYRDRRGIIQVARQHGARVVGYWFPVPRWGPPYGGDRVGLKAFERPPKQTEGFDELYRVSEGGPDGQGRLRFSAVTGEVTE